MKRHPVVLGTSMLAALFVLASPLAAQQPDPQTTAARAEGKAFGQAVAPTAQTAATTPPDATRVPGFTDNPPQSGFFDNPDALGGAAASAASTSDGYQAMRRSLETRAKFDATTISDTTTRAKTIAADPLAYASGMSVTGNEGRCVPLPPSTSSPGRYTATCNTGYTLADGPSSCAIQLAASVQSVSEYLYYCSADFRNRVPPCTPFESTCTLSGSHDGRCLRGGIARGSAFCSEPGEPVDEYTCAAPAAGFTPVTVSNRQVVTTARDESQCAALATDTTCASPVETCTDRDSPTRTIDGIAVTAPCWAWRRDYQCNRFTPAEDCTALASSPGCTFVREDCLTDEAPCRTYERVYDCPLPPEPEAKQQFICDGDIACIDGQCETIEREPNTEFKDAVVALGAMAQANREFDPATLSLFKGTRNTCSSQVFGAINCCKGKGFALLPGSSLLVALGCSRAELLLHERDAQGLCAYVGSYCSDSVLGVCLTRKKVYCCFESRLSRILQEQGRAQLPKPWAKPKAEQCLGFTIDEFARLDLSRMDFSEIYAEFTQGARLPDELTAAAELQQKIEDFYAANKP